MTCCFVPGCKCRNSRKKGEKVSLFTPPRDEAKFKKWQRMIPRKDRPLRRCDRVCQHHFMPEHIQYDYVHIINGETVRLPRLRPTLTEDAYPCIFPGLPKYLTKIPKNRKPPANRSIPVKKVVKNKDERNKSTQSDSDVYCGLNLDEAPPVENKSTNFSFANVINNVNQVRLPSPQWGSHVDINKNCVIFSHVTFATNKFVVDKMLILDESLMPKFSNNTSVVSTDFYSTVRSMNNLETVIRSLDNRRVCSGIVPVPVNEGPKAVNIKKVHERCKIFLSDQTEGDLCANCKVEKQRLTNLQDTVRNRKNLHDKAKRRLQRENRRLHSKVSQLMKKPVSRIEAEDCNQLEIAIGNLIK